MALLFIDGFDAADFAQKWPTVTGNISSSTDTRFNSGRSLYFQNASSYLTKSITPINKVMIGFTIKFDLNTSFGGS